MLRWRIVAISVAVALFLVLGQGSGNAVVICWTEWDHTDEDQDVWVECEFQGQEYQCLYRCNYVYFNIACKDVEEGADMCEDMFVTVLHNRCYLVTAGCEEPMVCPDPNGPYEWTRCDAECEECPGFPG